jgi:hypothetical protein
LIWTVLSDSKFSGDTHRPEFNEYSIRIIGFKDLSLSGVLELNFINNSLYKATFYASNPEEYFDAARKKYGAELGVRSISVGPQVIIESGKNAHNEVYIRWSDQSLSEEVDEWIRRFS